MNQFLAEKKLIKELICFSKNEYKYQYNFNPEIYINETDNGFINCFFPEQIIFINEIYKINIFFFFRVSIMKQESNKICMSIYIQLLILIRGVFPKFSILFKN